MVETTYAENKEISSDQSQRPFPASYFLHVRKESLGLGTVIFLPALKSTLLFLTFNALMKISILHCGFCSTSF